MAAADYDAVPQIVGWREAGVRGQGRCQRRAVECDDAHRVRLVEALPYQDDDSAGGGAYGVADGAVEAAYRN
jgi:hypothetical protein